MDLRGVSAPGESDTEGRNAMKSKLFDGFAKGFSELGERLRRLRLQSELTQAKLAERCRISRSHLCGLERGLQRPSRQCLERIAQALEVSMEELLDGIRYRPKPRGCKKLLSFRKALRAAFPVQRRPRFLGTLPTAYREATYYRLGPVLLERLDVQPRRPARFWTAVKAMAGFLNGAEQMTVLQALDRGAGIEEIHPHRLGFGRPVVQEAGRWWLALVLQLEEGWLVLFPQVSVDVGAGSYYTLDFLAALSWRGQIVFLDIEVDGQSHQWRRDKDLRRAQQIGLPTVRIPVAALDAPDFMDRLLRACLQEMEALEKAS